MKGTKATPKVTKSHTIVIRTDLNFAARLARGAGQLQLTTSELIRRIVGAWLLENTDSKGSLKIK